MKEVGNSGVERILEVAQAGMGGARLQTNPLHSPALLSASTCKMDVAKLFWSEAMGVRGHEKRSLLIQMKSAVRASHVRVSGKVPLRLPLGLLDRSFTPFNNILKYTRPLCI